jgi:hypothetical protein
LGQAASLAGSPKLAKEEAVVGRGDALIHRWAGSFTIKLGRRIVQDGLYRDIVLPFLWVSMDCRPSAASNLAVREPETAGGNYRVACSVQRGLEGSNRNLFVIAHVCVLHFWKFAVFCSPLLRKRQRVQRGR